MTELGLREPNTFNKLESEVSGSAEEQGAEGAVGFRQALIVPQPAGHRASLPSLRGMEPAAGFHNMKMCLVSCSATKCTCPSKEIELLLFWVKCACQGNIFKNVPGDFVTGHRGLWRSEGRYHHSY